MHVDAQLNQLPATSSMRIGEVSGIRGLKLSVGTGSDNSSVLTSKGHDVSLEKHTLLLLVPAQGTYPRAETSSDAARPAPADASGVAGTSSLRPGPAPGHWRYLEDIPAEMLLTEGDVRTCRHLLLPGRWVSVRLLRRPPAAALAVAVSAHHAGCKVVLDGAPTGKHQAALLAAADVLRADTRETELLAGSAVRTAAEAEKLASDLLSQGPSLVALAIGGIGNLIAWPEDCILLPLTETQVVDTTGAGDAFTAALIMALAQGGSPQRAGRLAVAAAGATVGHPGGRPALTPKAVQDRFAPVAESSR